MSDSAWAYLMMGAFCLGVDHGMEPPKKASLRGTAWQASLLLLWPAVLTLGAVRMRRKHGLVNKAIAVGGNEK